MIELLGRFDGSSRSVKESELRCLVIAAGLPVPMVNVDVFEDGRFLGCGDLVLREWRLVLEYEGRQHAFDDRQFRRDIDRYEGFRRAGWEYLQVTAAMLARPRTLVARIYATLVARGYDGPPPTFGPAWHALFAVPPVLGRPKKVDPQPKAS